MMTNKELQQGLMAAGIALPPPGADGKIGNDTTGAIKKLLEKEKVDFSGWNDERRRLAAMQIVMRPSKAYAGKIDGLAGTQTTFAFQLWNGTAPVRREIEQTNSPAAPSIVPKSSPWPTQSGVSKFYGAMGKNQTTIVPPYPMFIAWDKTDQVEKITLHEKVAESALRVLERVADHYTPVQIKDLGLDLFAGSLNVRKMKGGDAWSMHSWGIALDFDSERNQLKWGRDKARLGKPDAERFWQLWEEEGWLSLGRARNYDWMHVQAARL
jgi:hypothetical protein